MVKTIILNYNNAPYRDALLSYLGNKYKEIQIYNYFNSDNNHDYWQYNEFHFDSKNLDGSFFLGHRIIHLGILRVLLKKNIKNIIIPGNYHLTSLVACFLSFLKNQRIIFVTDNIDDKHKLFNFVKYFIFAHSFKIWVPGEATINYLINGYKVEPSKIMEGAYMLDYNSIKKSMEGKKDRKNAIKNEFGIPDKKIVLMVANFLPNRNYLLFFNLVRKFRDKQDIFFVIIGTGPELRKIRNFASKHNIDNYKIFEKVKFNLLSDFYSISDFYIHTGSEPYSTALQYAAIAGMPILSSLNVGAAWDYVEDKKNGLLVVNHKNLEEWEMKLNMLLNLDALKLKKMGEHSSYLAKERQERIYKQIDSVFLDLIYN